MSRWTEPQRFWLSGRPVEGLAFRPHCFAHMASICAKLNCLESFPAACRNWPSSSSLQDLAQLQQPAGNNSRQFSLAQMLAMWVKQSGLPSSRPSICPSAVWAPASLEPARFASLRCTFLTVSSRLPVVKRWRTCRARGARYRSV